MKFYTWCNVKDHPKVEVLRRSASYYGIKVEVLGEGIVWKRNYQKIQMLYNEIRDLDENEVILCTDAFDVLYLEGEKSILDKFINLVGEPEQFGRNKVIFSGEKLYSHHYPKYRKYWDSLDSPYGYRYLNSGTFIGYQKDVVRMLEWIIENSQNYKESSDQKLFAKYEVKNPGSILLDGRCKLFWCSGGEQKRFRELYQIDGNLGNRFLRCKVTGTYPSLIHIPSSKSFYRLILGISFRMNFITETEKIKYSKLHLEETEGKKEIKPSPRKICRKRLYLS